MPAGDLDAVVKALVAGKAAVVPTDTLYGIAVCPLYAPSPGVLYERKGRPSDKPVAWLVGSLSDLDVYGRDVADYARRLAAAYWPGALTVIVPASDAVPPAYRSAAGTIGLRMPASSTALAIINEVGPLATSSANRAGSQPPQSIDDVDSDLLSEVAAFVRSDEQASGIASKVIDATGDALVIVRE